MSTDPQSAFVWPFAPNWRESFRVTKTFRTDIFVSRSRREQRRALMSSARRRFVFEVVVNGADHREYEGLMHLAQDKPFIAPDWSRRETLAADALTGATEIVLASVPGWIVPGRALFLSDRIGRPVAVYVDSILGTTLTLTAALAKDWIAGTTVVPGPVGKLSKDLSGRHPTNNTAIISVEFDVEPASEPVVAPPAAPVTFNGREVCTFRPNWATAPTVNLMFPSETVDFSRGVTAQFFPFAFPDRLTRASFVATNAAEARALDEFMDRMKGQRGEFYMPTGANDLPPSQNLFGGSAILRVAGSQAHEHYATSKTHKAICVQLRDGTRLYRKVNSMAIDSGAGETVLTLASTWSTTVARTSVAKISWMPVHRLASDVLTLDWLTDAVAQCDLTMQTLEDLTPET